MKLYQIEKEIQGTKYVAQFNGLSAWLQCVDDSYIDGSNAVSTLKLAENSLKRGLIEPKVGVDDFETQEELQEVTKFVQDVMKGNFREKAEQKGIKAKG